MIILKTKQAKKIEYLAEHELMPNYFKASEYTQNQAYKWAKRIIKGRATTPYYARNWKERYEKKERMEQEKEQGSF